MSLLPIATISNAALGAIWLAVLKLARDGMDKPRHMVAAAKLDQSDVVMSAYYMDHPLED